jgi:hypothetical protein
VKLAEVAASNDGLDLAPYAGRWIGIVRGQVAGVGLSPEEARRLAKRNRPREEPVIVFVSDEGESSVIPDQGSPKPSEGKR